MRGSSISTTMVRLLGCCYTFYFLSFVSGWSFSPYAPKTAVKTFRKGRTTTDSIPWKRRDLLFSRSKSFLAQDFTDGESDDFDQDGGSGGEYFDDFSDFDFVVGGGNYDEDDTSTAAGSSSTPSQQETSMSVLQQRFQKIALNEQVNKQQISDNWKDGFWGVWGCSLDPYTTEDAETKTLVTCLRLMPSSEDEIDEDDSALLIVGRSDGSLCWLQMETLLSPASQSASDNVPQSSVENRSITTYFENKLVAKPTENGGMVVDKALQRRETDGTEDDSSAADGASPRLPFDILAQIQTAPKGSDPVTAAIVDMLPISSARMLLTISQCTPNVIQGWNLLQDSETGCLLPNSSTIDIETIHTSPIVSMKSIPKSDGYENHSEPSLVVSVSDNGQTVVWELILAEDESPASIRIKLNANLLKQDEEFDGNDFVSAIDVDDEYLYVGTQAGKISIFSLSCILEENENSEAGPLFSLPVVKSFLAFTSNNPGVSTLLAAGPGSLGGGKNSNGNSRPPTKSLIAGDMSGGLKQWELIPAGQGRLEYWPRLATQKLPGGRPHVYETRNKYAWEDNGQNNSFSPAIRELLCIQQVLLAATDHDLTVWDSSTGKMLYDMQGLDFDSSSYQRPSLIAANDSVLISNGMENFVCVHDFTMERITSENVQDYLEQDNGGNNSDEDGDGSFGNDSTSNW